MIARGGPWPGDIDPSSLYSRAYREARSRALAVWAGLPEDAVNDFVARMEVSWMRQVAAEEGAAAAALDAARANRERAEGRGDLVRLRGNGLTRVRPRTEAV